MVARRGLLIHLRCSYSAILGALLRAQGFVAVHTLDIGLDTSHDKAIWDYANTRNAIIVIKDKDFARLVVTTPGVRVLLVRTGNCSKTTLKNKVMEALPKILAHFDAGKWLVELR